MPAARPCHAVSVALAVAVGASALPAVEARAADGWTLTLLADTSTPAPVTTPASFIRFSQAAIDGERVVFLGRNTANASMDEVYTLDLATAEFFRIAGSGTPIPGVGQSFVQMGQLPSISGDRVVFAGFGASSIGVYTALFDGTALERVADSSTPVPGAGSNFSNFDTPDIDGGEVVFRASFPGGTGLFSTNPDGDPIVPLVTSATQVPGQPAGTTFNVLLACRVNGPMITFRARYLSDGGEQIEGVWNATPAPLVDTTTPVPQGAGAFSTITASGHGASGQGIAFRGLDADGLPGVYRWDAQGLHVAANTATPAPDSGEAFVSFGGIVSYTLATHADGVAFLASTATRQGLYHADGRGLSTIITDDAAVEETVWDQFELAPLGMDDGRVVFTALDNDTGRRALFLAEYEPAKSEPCPGDTNGDLTVDLADLNAVLAAFGESVPGGEGPDVSGDGQVDLADLNLVLAGFGTGC